MVFKYASMRERNLGKISVMKHRIDQTNPYTRLIHLNPYRAGPLQHHLECDEANKILPDKVAQNAITEWTLPVVSYPKKDSSLRFCVEYRPHNALTVCDSYPVSKMDDCIDSLGSAAIFRLWTVIRVTNRYKWVTRPWKELYS